MLLDRVLKEHYCCRNQTYMYPLRSTGCAVDLFTCATTCGAIKSGARGPARGPALDNFPVVWIGRNQGATTRAGRNCGHSRDFLRAHRCLQIHRRHWLELFETLDDFVVLFLLFGGISEREELKASQVVHT